MLLVLFPMAIPVRNQTSPPLLSSAFHSSSSRRSRPTISTLYKAAAPSAPSDGLRRIARSSFPQKLHPRTISGVARAKLVRFTGRKEVTIAFRERALPPGEYLKETERIVNVTFPDSARIQYVGDSVWQARLTTITFFDLSATPFTDVRVIHDDGVLTIDSNRLVLDVTGLPDRFRNMDLQLNLHGELRAFPRRTEEDPMQELWDFGGWVDIGVAVNLPLPLSLIPEKLVTGVGDQVVERILGAMEGALLQGIIADYNAWCGPAAGQQTNTAEMRG